MNDLTEEERLSVEISQEEQAKKIINNPLFQKVFVEYSGQLYNALKRTKWNESEEREEIYRQLKSLDTMEAKFTEALQTGKLARHQLTLMQKAAKKVKNVIGLR
jgi:O-phosphoseryl-tRNA(Cys) synthetase